MRKSGIGWFIGVGLVAMLLAIGNLIYTCTRNDGEKYAQQYIDESKYVTLHIPKGKMDVDYGPESIMTGVLMNSTERIRTDSLAFYDKYYKKYFCVFVIDIDYRKTIRARINKYELDSPRYGSRENPVPVLDFDYNLQEFRDAY